MNGKCINPLKVLNSPLWRMIAVILLGTLQIAAFIVVIRATNIATAAPAAPTNTITVDTTIDEFVNIDGKDCSTVVVSDLPGPDGNTTLREAICASNNTASGAPHTIGFNLGDSGVVYTITIMSGYAELPYITRPLTIDGTTEPGYSGLPLVVIDGHQCLYCTGLVVSAGDSTIEGLVINQFANGGLELNTKGSNTIRNNYIGTNSAGDLDLNDGYVGVLVSDSPKNNIQNNLISGNGSGIYIINSASKENVIRGNKIGTNAAGTDTIPNYNGIQVSDAPTTTIGGTGIGEGNLISGNSYAGIYFQNSMGHIIQGNKIGTTLDGNSKLGNGVGISALFSGKMLIGGSTASAGNLISGNANEGIVICGPGGSNTHIKGNKIGTNQDGTQALGNFGNGIDIQDCGSTSGKIENIVIGGLTTLEGNLISANDQRGIFVGGEIVTGTQILGNKIGTDISGNNDLGNGYQGITIHAGNLKVGGTANGAGNLISGNGWQGISIYGYTGGEYVRDISIKGNKIGTNAAGLASIPNSKGGIWLQFASYNTIGGGETGAGNLISGNTQNGIEISGDIFTASYNTIQGNLIGVDLSGTLDMGNAEHGILISGAFKNQVGGANAGEGNVISGNDRYGISITSTGNPGDFYAYGNTIQGNRIGTNATGTAAVGNAWSGINLEKSDYTIIGGGLSGAGNLISGNQGDGISLSNSSNNNQILGNRIGTSADGMADLGNKFHGVVINNASSNNIGGSDAGEGNLISGNDTFGIHIQEPMSANNLIYGNKIGMNSLGAPSLPNMAGVVVRGGASDNTIGGTSSGQANEIAGNTGLGISVEGSNTLHTLISGNSIHDNGGLGISLDATDVTPNDLKDPDMGPNLLQNFPVLSSSWPAGGSTIVKGLLNSLVSTQFTVQFFSVPTCDSSGYGEGKVYLGSTTVNTDANGDAAINLTLPVATTAFHYLTAVAIDPQNNTSEFSPCSLIAHKIHLPLVIK